MRRLIVFVTNVMFAGHVLFGCCLHHAHGCTAKASSHRECAHHHGCAHHEHAHSEHGPDHEPADQNAPAAPCDHGRCNYVKCESHRVDLATVGTVWSPLVGADLSPSTYEQSAAAHDLSAAARPGDCPLFMLCCALLL